MPNSDNQDGVHNKKTDIYSKADGDSITFADVAAAKAYLLSAAALTVIDECATQVEWELVSNTGLKVTYAFGTKGTGTEPADDWTAQFGTRSKALWDERKGPFNVSAISFDHSDTGQDEATVTAASHTFIAGERVVFDSLGGFTGTAAEGNMNETSSTIIASVSGNDFVTGPTMNLGTKTYTNGGTAQALDNSWQKNGSTWATSTDHLF
jgi:hypothetical protein